MTFIYILNYVLAFIERVHLDSNTLRPQNSWHYMSELSDEKANQLEVNSHQHWVSWTVKNSNYADFGQLDEISLDI